MRAAENDERALIALTHDLAGLRLQACAVRLGLSLERRFDPDQPREPAGSREGGRWAGGRVRVSLPGSRDGRLRLSEGVDEDGYAIASAVNEGDRDQPWDERHVVVAPDGSSTIFETRGSTQTIRDGATGMILSRSTWGPKGPETEAIRQDAFLRLSPTALSSAWAKARAAAMPGSAALYNWLSSGGGTGEGIPTASLKAREYRSNITPTPEFLRESTREEVDGACPQHGTVQSLTDEAARAAGQPRYYPSMAVYGTRVHTDLKARVEALGNPNLIPEVSVSKSDQERGPVFYSQRGTVRIDILERVGNGTTCVYDIKTGRSGLNSARMVELASAAKRRFPETTRLLVIETRPSALP